jgi:hypothetical protein
MHHNSISRSAGYYLSAAVMLAVAAASASAWAGPADPVNPLTKRFVQGKALDICDQGALFVGGVPKVPSFGDPRQVIIGHMYVQFEIPTKHRKWPLIFIHGGGLTGSTLDATPNGTEGWFAHAVSNNYATFVVDQPGRGRSGFDTTVLNEAKVTNNLNLIPTFSDPAPSGIWTSWFGHIIPAGSNIITGTMIRHGDPGDINTPETDPPSEAHGAYPPLYPIPPVDSSIDANIQARIGAIGAAPNPANNTYLALNAYKWHVSSTEVTLPGSVCATCVPTALSPGDTWSPRDVAELVERLGGAILSPHSQSMTQVLQVVRLLKEKGKLNLVKGILVPEGAGTSFTASGTTPQDYDHIPFLLANGDYRPGATRVVNRAFFAQLSAGPTHQYVDLDSPAFGGKYLGQTHMNMLGTNNIAVLDFLLNFADANIPNPIVATSCPSGNGQGNNGQGQNGQGQNGQGQNGQH